MNTVGGFIVRVPTYFSDANPSMLRCRLANRRRISSSAASDKHHLILVIDPVTILKNLDQELISYRIITTCPVVAVVVVLLLPHVGRPYLLEEHSCQI